MGVPVGFTYFYLFAEDFGMGAVRTAGRSAAPAAAGTRVDTKVSALVNPVSFISCLAQIRERRPLRNRGTAEDFYFRIFLNLFAVSDSLLLHIPAALRRRSTR